MPPKPGRMELPSPAQTPLLCFTCSNHNIAVSNSAQLQAVLSNAGPGTCIAVDGGTYNGSFRLGRMGTASAPIVVQAKQGSMPVFTGSFQLSGQYGILSGLRFQRGSVEVSGRFNRVSRNILDRSPGTAISLSGQNNRVDHNEIIAAGTWGIRVMAGSRDGATHSNRVDRNYLHDMTGKKANAHEGIQLGQSRAPGLPHGLDASERNRRSHPCPPPLPQSVQPQAVTRP